MVEKKVGRADLKPGTCVLDMPSILASTRRDLAESNPGLKETGIRCPFHGDWHVFRPNDLILEASTVPCSTKSDNNDRRLPPIPANAGPNFCRWHRTASTWLFADCAHCGVKDRLHVHLDVFGKAKHERVTENCPACHRPNAIRPKAVEVWKLKEKDRANDAITAMRIDGQGFAQQKELIR